MGDQTAQVEGLTFTAVMEELGVPEGYQLWSEAGGEVSGLELIVFRGALESRVRERTTETDSADAASSEDYEPAAHLPEALQAKLQRAHGIGVTVADILLDKEKMEAAR